MNKRPVYLITRDIIRVWWENRSKKNQKLAQHQWRQCVYFGAVPYLEALLTLINQEETPKFGWDTLDSVILYGLSNMSSFRGPKAKALKEELRAHLSTEAS